MADQTSLSITIPGPESLGPKMRALANDMQRRFVWALLHLSAPREAAIAAGYSDVSDGARVRASELMQNPAVQEALYEVGWNKLNSMAIKSIHALEAIIDDPKHPKHHRAIEMVLNRTGFAAVTEHKVTVNHGQSNERMEKLAKKLAAELGIDAARLIGVNRVEPEAIDAEFTEVQEP